MVRSAGNRLRWIVASVVVIVVLVTVIWSARQLASPQTSSGRRLESKVSEGPPPNTRVAEIHAPDHSAAKVFETPSRAIGAQDTLALAPGPDVSNIDWTSVRETFPIPRQMPTGEADTAYGAGFAPEWVEKSIGRNIPMSGRYGGRCPLIPLKPMILEIMSEAKGPDDNWAHGLEYELRRVLEAEYANKRAPTVTRTFCNRHGCLVYLEFDGKRSSTVSAIPMRILKAPWHKQFGITGDNVFNITTATRGLNIEWQLMMIHMHPTESCA
jgi:hypothetical protein